MRARKGTVLLLALLIMSGILITGATLGTISVLTLRQSRTIDDSAIAFSAAESGAEQSLYQLRRLGAGSAALNGAPNDTSSASVSGPPMTGSKWSRTLTTSEPAIFTNLAKDKTYEVVMWDPENPGSNPQIESMKYVWDDDCGGNSGLETIVVGWDPAVGGTSPFSADIGFHGTSPAITYLHDPAGIIDNGFASGRAYRVRLRAKSCNIYNLNITAYQLDNAGGLVRNIPSRVAVSSTGEFGTSRQAVEFRLPRLQPLTGVFDYVIFSQCSILKGVAGPACP